MLKNKTVEVPDVIYTEGDKKLEIYTDQNPEDPRKWNQFSIMKCKWNDYRLGDEEIHTEHYEGWNDVENHIMDSEEVVVMLPIYIYEHSSMTISTTPFHNRWDSGRAGVIYTTEEQIEKCGLEDKTEEELKEMLKEDVETYDHYIRGEVYRFVYYENEEKIDFRGNLIGEIFGGNSEVIEQIEDELGIEDLSNWEREDNY